MKLITLLFIILFSSICFGQNLDFQSAYAQNPLVPKGLLEAVSWSNTRMVHLSDTGKSCIGIPQAYGVMGLIDDGQDYFIENGKKIEELTGISVAEQKADANMQILAYANAFQKRMEIMSPYDTPERMIKDVLEFLSEIPAKKSPMNAFALDLQTSQIFNFLNSNEKANEYNFSAHKYDMDVLYGSENLNVLFSSKIYFENGQLKGDKSSTYTVPAEKSIDYTPAIWDPAPSCNFSSRNGTAVSAITIHTVQGTYAGAISWAQNCNSSVSYHYVIRSSDGQVTQLVDELDKAWHVGSENPYTIGYEHEGYVDNPAWYTENMYVSSADLSRDIVMSGYGISPLRTYYGPSSASVNVIGGCTKIKGHQHYPNQTHTDPGINWNWEKYYKLINNTPIINSITSTSGGFYDTGGASGAYQDDERELWLFEPPGAVSVSLNFTSFDIEANWDFMFIYDGSTTDDPLIGVYTGTNSPGTINSSGGTLLVEFRSDCATVNPGWEASYSSTTSDMNPPTTLVSVNQTWQTDDFIAYFDDSDIGSGVGQRFYQVTKQEIGANDRSSLEQFGFAYESFEDNDDNWFQVSGTYSINNGTYEFTDISNSNSNVYMSLDQNIGNTYLYDWHQTITSADVNQRAGMHFFCDNPNLPNRGNSYFVYFRESNDMVQIYSVDNDVFNLEVENPATINQGQEYHCQVTYDPLNGLIRVFMDGAFVSQWQDSVPLTSGSFISLRTGGCSARFDNIRTFISRESEANISAGDIGEELLIESINAVPTGFVSSQILDNSDNWSSLVEENILLDFTAPEIEYLIDGIGSDIDTFTTPAIEGEWNAIDMHSDIGNYEYSIGTLPQLDDVIPWTNGGLNSSLLEVLANPVYNQVYYIGLRATNNAGLTSIFVSNGQRFIPDAGIHESDLMQVTMYPNPAANEIRFNGLKSDVNVTISDLKGAIVYTSKVNSNTPLNISNLATGSYRVLLLVDNNFIVLPLEVLR